MKVLSNLSLYGTLGLNSVTDANTDTDKFLVIDSNGIVRYRTGQELYNDIGAGGAAAYTSVLQHEVKAGVALTKGQAVYVTSADGTNMIVGKASNASEATSSKTLGLIAQDLAINGKGFVITEGLLSGLNTMAAGSEGDPVWLGTDGNLIYGLGSKPYAPDHLVFIGIVTRKNANNGEIFVKVQNGFELQELHNVQITSTPSDNTVLAYETSTSLYKMKSISTLLGYTPTTNARTLTINGTAYDLSADRSWSVGTTTGSGSSGQVAYWNGSSSQTGSNNLFWDTANNRLGIGLTNPQRRLEIYSSTADSHLRLSGSAPSVSLGEAITGSIYQAKFGLATASGQYSTSAAAGDFVIISQTGSTIWMTGTTDRLKLFYGGNFVVGGGSDSGLAKLQVVGAIQQSSVTSSMIKVDSNGVIVAASAGSDYLSPSALSGYATQSWVTSQGYLTSITSSQVTTALGYTPYNSSNPSGYITSAALSGYATQSWVTSQGYITGVTNISGYSYNLYSQDIRTIAPSSHGSYRLNFGFTSWANNNSSPYADYLHFRSYSDGSGGADNLVMFLKSGIGMRIWQQSFGSASAYSSYVDVLHSSNYNSYSPTLTGGGASGTWGISITGNADTVDGYHASTSTIGNYIVVRDGNGYIFGNYINMTDNSVGSGVTGVIVKQGDNYYRTGTAGAIQSFLGLGSMAYASTGSYLPLSGGTMTGQIYGPTIGTGVYDGFIQVREYGYVGSGQSSWSYAPAITYHWGNRTVVKVGVRADGLFAIDDQPFALRSWVTSQGYITGYTETDTLATVVSRGATTTSAITINKTGTLISHAGMSDAIGYNSSYGTYIGSNVGGTYYIYANGTFYDAGTIRTLIHSGNIGSQSVNYASTVGINYSNDSNSTYQLLWGSGNSVYGTAGVYVNPYTDYVTATSFQASDWFRSSGTTGWYNSTYAVGIYAIDSTWVRTYNDAQFYSSTIIQAGASMRAPIFYDANNTTYFWDGNAGKSMEVAGGVQLDGLNNYNAYLAFNNASTYWGIIGNYGSNDWRIGIGNYSSLTNWNLRWDASGNTYHNGTANFNYISNGSVWINNGSDYNAYNENIRLFNAPNGVSVIAFSASGTSGMPTTSILGYSDRLEFRYNNGAQYRIYNGYTWTSGDIYTDTKVYTQYGMRLGEIWGYGGVYRSSGDMMFGVESGGWRFHYQNSQKVYIGTDGNIWMAWAGDYISNLLAAKLNASSAPRATYSNLMYYAGFTLDANSMPDNSNGFTYSVGAPYTGPIMKFGDGGYAMQINGTYGGSGASIAYRTRNGDAGSWNSWYTFITTANIGSQSVSYASNSGALNGWGYGSYAYRSSGSGYYQIDTWMSMNGNFGIYWPSYYGLHLYPNQSSYGALQINGSKNGWSGIYFNDSANTLMMNPNESGHYNVSYGWQFRWYNGTMYVSTGSYGGGSEYTVIHSGNISSYTAGNVNSISSAVGGSYTWTSTNYFQSNLGGYCGSLATPPLQAYATGGNSAFFSFHRAGNYAVNMGLDADNVLRIGGWSASSNRWQLDMSGNMTVAGDLTAYSDVRVKTNIKTIENALDKVLNLRGVSYTRTDSEDKKTKIGVIAQETLPIVPEVVNQDNDGMYNVSYGNFGGLFIEAFKEQQKQIKVQAEQIDKLKSIIDVLTK